ncbi:UDP-glycosyltransferase 76E2, partial [Trametes pubescens]
HIRPACTLAARIVKLDRTVNVTFFTAARFFYLAQAEISRSFVHGEDAATRLRIIALQQHEHPLISDTYEEAFGEAWTKLATKQPITCAKTGIVHGSIPVAPKQVILDLFVPRTHSFIRKEAPGVKIYTWYTFTAYSGFYLFGPESLGGRGNLFPKVEEETKTGKPFNVAATEIFCNIEGKVIRVPGLPPMYDYEYDPQVMPLPPQLVGNSLIKAHELFLKSDGVITMSPADLEPEAAVVAFRQWLTSLGKTMYFAGPLVPDDGKADAGEQTGSIAAQKIQAFLDRQLQERGRHYVLYISFGSMFFPLNPDVFAAFIEVVMEQHIPFIVSHPSPLAVFSEELKAKVERYGNGFFSSWAPQQALLRHPATGWFVTHAGLNSTLEAIHAGVPLICWPFLHDQPVNTIVLTETHRVAYELLEVRTGQGLRPIFRTGKAPTGTLDAVRAEARDVLARAFGEEGAQMRARLVALRERVNGSWAEGGASRKDMEAFVATLQ